MWLYGKTGRKFWSRPFNTEDWDVLQGVDSTPLPSSVPIVAIPWGDLYRGGYHQGISHVHHFYTRRNLIVFGKLWEYTAAFGRHLQDALKLWLLSYNASHATLMSRVVAKSNQPDLVVTSAQPGVLYFSGLPVEKNLINGLRRKRATIARAFEVVDRCKGKVDVHQKSSCQLDLASRSIDYVFTDPPFGANIPYAEVSFLNEAWLGSFTDRTEEAIVSRSQSKTLDEYREILSTAFREIRRVLKPHGNATVVFHSASAAVWHAVQAAYVDAGFGVQRAGVLGKTQGSFKQVTTQGAVRGDALILLGDPPKAIARRELNVWTVAERIQREADSSATVDEKTAQRLYSRLVTYYLRRDPARSDRCGDPLSVARATHENEGAAVMQTGEGIASLRRVAREYERTLSPERRKLLGQYFSGASFG